MIFLKGLYKASQIKRVRLGRPGTSLKMGLLGMANIGKSSTFNLICKLNVPAQNRPFCTIDPNTAFITVNDARFNSLCEIYKPAKTTGPILRVVDIAGLVKGAAEGFGLGNQFLSHVLQVDGLYHVVRAFPGENIAHTEGSMNPVRDIQIIRQQLILKDLQVVNKKVHQLSGKASRTQDKTLKNDFETLKRVQSILKSKQQLRNQKWNIEEIGSLNRFLFLTSKPMVYLLNMSKKDFLQNRCQDEQAIIKTITLDGKFQTKMIKFSVEHQQNRSQNQQSKIQQIIRAGYQQLQIIHYYTVGVDEVKAWAVRLGDTAVDGAGKIHTDFIKNLINAEVIHSTTLIQHPQYKDKLSKYSKKQGKVYKIKDGDVIHFNCKKN